MSVATFTKSGSKATTPAKLNKDIFGLKVANHELLKQAYLAYLANGRGNAAQTLKRGEVRGGGRKPWRQKGTGRARFGSIRNPIWRGGGIAFGPTGDENYSHNLSLASKRQALRQALSVANEADKVSIIEDVKFNGKTSEAVKLLAKLGASKNVLLAVDVRNDELNRSTSNLANVKVVQATYLNVYDILNSDSLIITKAGLEKINEWLGSK